MREIRSAGRTAQKPTSGSSGNKGNTRGNTNGNTPSDPRPAWLLAQPEPFVPFRGGRPAEAWYVLFLSHYAVHGGKALAASAAGVTLKHVQERLASDPAFADECHEAHKYHCDLLEFESLDLARRKGNPLPYFDRLKAELPERHVERLQVAAVTVDLTPAPEDLRATMIGVLRHLTPTTRSLLLQRPEGLAMLEDPEYRAAFLSGDEEFPALPASGTPPQQ